jgi:hypothetical protein
MDYGTPEVSRPRLRGGDIGCVTAWRVLPRAFSLAARIRRGKILVVARRGTHLGPQFRNRHMIAPEELLSYVTAKPFRPFRIHMASGETFDVRHPEIVRVGRLSLMLFTFVSENPKIYDRWETLSLVLMEWISQLEATVPPSGN